MRKVLGIALVAVAALAGALAAPSVHVKPTSGSHMLPGLVVAALILCGLALAVGHGVRKSRQRNRRSEPSRRRRLARGEEH
jgi:peptidoglycan/LPS O-acetylase OafA/YrhL